MSQGTVYQPSYDRRPKYTVKEVAEVMSLTTYAVRYYDNAGLIPGVERTAGNIRMFSDYNLSWFRLVHCLRATGLSIDGIKEYIAMCLKGECTLRERAEMIFRQEKILRDQIENLQKQMQVLQYKKSYYEDALKSGGDRCNPATDARKSEPEIAPAEA